ncbi:MAG: hypothetical protein ACJAY5_000935 [Actinomycetes bacterium]|jgi:hypothetical protein
MDVSDSAIGACPGRATGRQVGLFKAPPEHTQTGFWPLFRFWPRFRPPGPHNRAPYMEVRTRWRLFLIRDALTRASGFLVGLAFQLSPPPAWTPPTPGGTTPRAALFTPP